MKVTDKEIIDYVVAHSKQIYPKYVVESDLQCFNSKELYLIWLSLVYSKRKTLLDSEIEVFDRCLKYVRDVRNMRRINEGT